MPPTEDTQARRVGADGDETTPEAPNDGVLTASIPGANPDKFVTLTLAHPLNEKDRIYLGLPKDGKTEVGQQVRVNRNGASAIINAGYATVDPENHEQVRSTLRGETTGEPTAEPAIERQDSPLVNPPKAQSTPGSGGGESPKQGGLSPKPDDSAPPK